MKRNKLFSILILVVMIMMAGSCESGLVNTEGEGQMTLSLLIPDYLSQNKSISRAIASQSYLAVLFLDNQEYASVALSQFTDDETEGIKSYAFNVPAKTFTHVGLELRDINGTALTRGDSEGTFTISSETSLDLELSLVPVLYEEPHSIDDGLSGTLGGDQMAFYKIIGANGAIYTFTNTESTENSVDIYLFDKNGIKLSSGKDSLESTFSSIDDTYEAFFVGVYSADAGSYSISISMDDTGVGEAGNPVLINEIRFGSDQSAIELYNNSEDDIALDGYQLVIQYRYDWTGAETYTRTIRIPGKSGERDTMNTIPAGGYLMISGYKWGDYFSGNLDLSLANDLYSNVYDSSKINYIASYNENSSSYGFSLEPNYDFYSLELLDASGVGLDFVQIGGLFLDPQFGSLWNESYGAVEEGCAFSYDTTLERRLNGSPQDTNSALDWQVDYGTLGVANDTTQDQYTTISIN